MILNACNINILYLMYPSLLLCSRALCTNVFLCVIFQGRLWSISTTLQESTWAPSNCCFPPRSTKILLALRLWKMKYIQLLLLKILLHHAIASGESSAAMPRWMKMKTVSMVLSVAWNSSLTWTIKSQRQIFINYTRPRWGNISTKTTNYCQRTPIGMMMFS